MSDYKLSKELKKQMERELRQYTENKHIFETVQNNISTRTMLIIAQRIKYVENVYSNLKDFEKQIFNFIFVQHKDCLYCERNHNISKSTYYNILNKCVILLAQEWGEI